MGLLVVATVAGVVVRCLFDDTYDGMNEMK